MQILISCLRDTGMHFEEIDDFTDGYDSILDAVGPGDTR